MNLNVGKLIYLYKENSEMLYPCVVVEEIIKKTINDEVKTYSIMLPDENKTIIPFDSLTSKIFETIDDFIEFSKKEHEIKIKKLTKKCKDLSRMAFSKFENKDNQKPLITKEEENYVMLENGIRARLKLGNNEKINENTIIPNTTKKPKRSKEIAKI